MQQARATRALRVLCASVHEERGKAAAARLVQESLTHYVCAYHGSTHHGCTHHGCAYYVCTYHGYSYYVCTYRGCAHHVLTYRGSCRKP